VLDDGAPLLELEPDGWAELEAPAADLPFFFVLSLLEPALAPVDSRDALPAEAPETSEPELDRGVTPVRFEGKLPESVVEGAVWPVGEPAPGADWLELPPAEGGAPWAKAPVAAPAAARAATAQSVVMVRIRESSLRAPSGL
jgi:hypothetical protein